MNPKLLAFVTLLTFAALQSYAQQSIIIANKIQVKDSIKLGGKWYSKFPDTASGGVGDTTALMRKANNLGDLTNLSQAKVNLGLANVDNTSDSSKFAMPASLTNKVIDGANNTFVNIPKAAIPLLQTALDSNLKKGDTTALMRKLNNLGDVADAAAARSNLGISVVGHSGLFSDLGSKPNTLGGYNITDGVPSSRTITINGTTQDLSSSRSWTINATNALSTLTDVTILGVLDGQLARYNNSTGKWINFSVDSNIIALWNGYKPLGLRDTSFLVPLRRFLDSMALVDNLSLQAPLYYYNNGSDSGLALQADTPIYNAGKFLSIPINSTPPTDGQVPTFDLSSSSLKFKTPTAATSGATDISVIASPDSLNINSSTGNDAKFPLASDINAGAESPTEHQRLNKFTNFYNNWSPAQTAGANILAYGVSSPDSLVFRALKALNGGGFLIDTLLSTPQILIYRYKLDTNYTGLQAYVANHSGTSGVAGVTTFNGRAGLVLPQNGDYTWAMLSGKPTTLSSAGITDPVVVTSGFYQDPGWLASLSAGKITNILTPAHGGIGVGSLTGIAKGNGTSAFTAAVLGTDYAPGTSTLGTGILKNTTGTGALSIASSADFPLLNQNTTGTAGGLSVVNDVAHGGTGAATLNGYIRGNGGSPFTSSATIPGGDVIGNISGNAAGITNNINESQVTNLSSDLAGKSPLAGSTSITTVGPIGIGVWQATKVGLSYGGTNTDLSATGGASQVLKQTTVGGNITVGRVTDGDVLFSDVSTNDASPSSHGYLPKLPGIATQFLNGTGGFSDPLAAFNVASGKYTPTVVGGIGGLTSLTFDTCIYIRVGNTVMMSGFLSIVAPSATNYSFHFALPFPSNIVNHDGFGTVSSSVVSGFVGTSNVDHTGYFNIVTTTGGTMGFAYTYTYIIH